MRLIINADDFGLSNGVNDGIVCAYKFGAVRSTTLLVNAAAFGGAAALAQKNDGLGVGVHLNLTSAKPISPVKTLIAGDGNFFRLGEFLEKLSENYFDKTEIENEWRAQIERARSAGFKITHLDSHHHVHLRKQLFDIAVRLAVENKLPLRFGKLDHLEIDSSQFASTDHFSLKFYEDISLDILIGIIEPYKNTDTSLEIMAHPAYIDEGLKSNSSYIAQRAKELEILTSKEFLQYIKDNNICIGNYATMRG
jgi:predicted glycoside hydrolase/deacetylase ChbG (UPF0249 family)